MALYGSPSNHSSRSCLPVFPGICGMDTLSNTTSGVSSPNGQSDHHPPRAAGRLTGMRGDSSGTVQAQTGRRRRESTIADVLSATRRLLTSGTPVAKLSIDKIVAEAGIARATFYLHFSDKHALIERLAEDEVAWREQVGAEALADQNLTRDAVEAMASNIVHRWVADLPVLSAIIELAEHDPRINRLWRDAMHQVANKAGEQFEARWANDPDRPTDPAMIAELFAWMLERACHQMLRDGDPRHADAVATSIAEILWRVLTYRA